jgi:hypothetical protein
MDRLISQGGIKWTLNEFNLIFLIKLYRRGRSAKTNNFTGDGGRVRFYSPIKFEGTKRVEVVDGVEFWVGNKSNFFQRERENDNGLIFKTAVERELRIFQKNENAES